jgi:hypothetical protein
MQLLGQMQIISYSLIQCEMLQISSELQKMTRLGDKPATAMLRVAGN